MNNMIIILIIVLTVLVTAFISLYFFSKKCNFVQYSLYPNLPPSSSNPQYTVVGKCLEKCDQIADKNYKNCNGNEQCIKNVYMQKSSCYLKCMN